MAARTTYSRSSRQERPRRIPPHVPLGALRHVAGWSLEKLGEEIAKHGVSRPDKGTLSAIESGLRGISVDLLNAIEAAYGLKPGTISTSYEPRPNRRTSKEAVA